MWGMPASFLAIPFAILLLVPVPDDEVSIIVSQFVVMFAGISMIGISSGFIAEDRTTMNLRFMGMAGVKPYQYLIGTCATLLLVSLGVNFLFALQGQYTDEILLNFMIISMLGTTNSMLLGITLGLSKIGTLTPLFGLLLGVGPIFADANETLSQIFHYTYTYQVASVIRGGYLSEDITNILQIILINTVVILAAFIFMNLRNGLDGERAVQP